MTQEIDPSKLQNILCSDQDKVFVPPGEEEEKKESTYDSTADISNAPNEKSSLTQQMDDLTLDGESQD